MRPCNDCAAEAGRTSGLYRSSPALQLPVSINSFFGMAMIMRREPAACSAHISAHSVVSPDRTRVELQLSLF